MRVEECCPRQFPLLKVPMSAEHKFYFLRSWSMQYKCLYIYIYIIFFSSACVFNVVVISIRNCFNKNNIMVISYIFELLFFLSFLNMRKFCLVKCRRLCVSYVWCSGFFAIGLVNVQAGVSEVGWQLPVSRGFRVALKWAHVCHLKLTVSMEEGGML